MKKFYLIFICLLFSTCIFCQERVPNFYGIPIDGTKEEMIQKLVETGNFIKFEGSNNYDLMQISKDAKDLGITPFVKISTHDGKVAVIQQDILHLTTAEEAKFLFNSFVETSSNSSVLSVRKGDLIPEKEDIYYEMRVNKKKYTLIVNNKIDSHDISTDLTKGLKLCEIQNKYIFSGFIYKIEMDEYGEFMTRCILINVRNADMDFCSGNFGKLE
ncbi:MAG: hypothetical protein IIW13_06415 [Paludibacteraceae bacterium]|nr:hypothetical protein [Paludibacteraceae bacterium]